MATCFAALQKSVHDLVEKVYRNQLKPQATSEAEVDEAARRENEQIDTSPVVEDVSAKDREALNFLRRTLEAKIHVLEIRIGVLEKEQPCRPRTFVNGLDRSNENECVVFFALLAETTTVTHVPRSEIANEGNCC